MSRAAQPGATHGQSAPHRGRRRRLSAAVVALAVGGGMSGLVGTGWADAGAGTAAAARAYDLAALRWDARDLAAPVPGWTRWRSVRIGGVLRRYLLSVPPGTRRPRPLILAFHGLGERAAGFAAQTGLVAAARAAGDVLVLPESEGPAFNDGRLGAGGPRDDTFTLTVIDRLTAQGWVDPGRVTVAGFSNGAGMAMAFAGAHPDAVAAVVSIDGEMIAAPGAPRPTGPVQAVLIHGTADPVQPWVGRRGRGVTWPSYVSVLATVHAWVVADHAGPPVQSVLHPPVSPAGGVGAAARLAVDSSSQKGSGSGAGSAPQRTRGGSRPLVSVTTWAAGPTGAAVSFYKVHGMGHRWPVSSAAAVQTSNDALEPVSATALIIDTAATAAVRDGPHAPRP